MDFRRIEKGSATVTLINDVTLMLCIEAVRFGQGTNNLFILVQYMYDLHGTASHTSLIAV